MATNGNEVFAKIRNVITEALGVDDEEVSLDATLQGDLGAESIDYLDIIFRLEKAFGIKIPKGELFPDDVLNNPEFVEGDRITPAGLQKLKTAMPHADFTMLESTPLVSKMSDVFTVQTIVNYVSSKLAA
ncbi:MAG: acyl carrier protein [Planctomycetota bacterium]